MNWLLIAVTAYFLNAIAILIDKTLLKRDIKNPFVYTFYIAAFGVAIIILALPFLYFFPIQIIWPGWTQFWVSIMAGVTFSIGLFFLFWGLKREEASRLTPMVGGLVPIFVLILASLLIDEHLSPRQLLAFGLIVAGTFLISLDFGNHQGAWHWLKQKLGLQSYNLPKIRKTLLLALPTAVFFAVSYTLTKDVYNHQPFESGFAWTRLGAFAVVFMPMLIKKNRRDLMHPPKNKNIKKARVRFLVGQASGGTSAVLVQYAISLASVSLVQALQGLQYVFVFLGALFLTLYHPKILKEKLSTIVMTQKIAAVVIIAFGMYLIA